MGVNPLSILNINFWCKTHCRYSWMHQKFCKSEVARKFDDKSFGGLENPIFQKLYASCLGPGHIHT
jgi:hypothetical protein